MVNVEEIKTAIAALPKAAFNDLRQWFNERDWENWDQQLAADANAGKLDFLMAEASDEKARGSLRDL